MNYLISTIDKEHEIKAMIKRDYFTIDKHTIGDFFSEGPLHHHKIHNYLS